MVLRDRRRLYRFGLLGLVPALLIGGYFFNRYSRTSPDREAEVFFRDYWHRPIALQGKAPSSFNDQEASLSPEACGSCHRPQYADWKESLHARAMGPGPWGQILDLGSGNPEEAAQCLTCHAPLGEQNPMLVEAGRKTGGRNPHFDPSLQLRGITCAACHMRQYRHFGPPKRDGVSYPADMPDHGGTQRTPYFESAEFCKDCHQFDPEKSLLVKGKPLQDTYREWLQSPWGKGGAACQECHMPDRRHLWKGIHDAEWVRGAVGFEIQLRSSEGGLEAIVEVINAAAGHKLPTYVTPKIFVRAVPLDSKGQPLSKLQQETVIGWDVRFEGGEWREHFDTRIPPGGKFQYTFSWPGLVSARRIRAWIEVHPDHFYQAHFYPSYLQSRKISSRGRRLIEQALADSSRSRYLLLEKTVALDRAG